MPAGAIFAAAANIGEDIGVARLDPEQAERAGAIGLAGEIGRRLRRAEAAIAVDQGGHRPGRAAPPDQEIWDPRPVARGGETLLDGESGGIELRRQALDGRRLPRRRHRVERGRSQHPFDADESEVGAGRHDMKRAVAGQVDRGARPVARRAPAQREQPPRNVVQRLHPEHAFRRRHLLDRLALARRHDQFRRTLPPRLDRRQIVGDERADGQSPAACFERPVQPDDEPAVEHVETARRFRDRQRQRQRAARRDQRDPARPGGEAAADEAPAAVAVGDGERGKADVGPVRLSDGLSGRQRRSPPPDFRDAAIARSGERFRAVIGDDDQPVGIEPGDVGLGFGQGEAALDESAGRDVELAGHIGVAAARAELDQAAAIIGREAVGAVPDPALALGAAERIDVDQNAPLGPPGEIGGARRDPPQAAPVGIVDPQIGDEFALDLIGQGDLALVVEQSERAVAHRGEAGSPTQIVLGRLVPRIDLGQRSFALNLLQPEIGILILGKQSCRDRQEGENQKHLPGQGGSPALGEAGR